MAKKKKEEEPFDLKKEILSWVEYIVVVLALTWVIITFVGQRTVVDGSSMEDNFHNGDNLIVEKLSYRFGDPDRFDVVVFHPQGAPKEIYIKRIIGLPGETIRVDVDGNIYVNGEVLEEDYGFSDAPDLNMGRPCEEVTLGEDEYFVLGDHRNNSTDSRFEKVGKVHISSIIGKAFVRIWPPSSGIGLIKK